MKHLFFSQLQLLGYFEDEIHFDQHRRDHMQTTFIF